MRVVGKAVNLPRILQDLLRLDGQQAHAAIILENIFLDQFDAKS
jgi:branched-subunit amino acid transport protein